MEEDSTENRYERRGVSSTKEEVHAAIKKLDKGLFANTFCKITTDYLTGDEEYCLVMHADGAGTKSSLAYAYYKETGKEGIWKDIAQDSLIMNLDDLICVGATNSTFVVSSTINRNKKHVDGKIISALINGNEQVISDLKALGINLVSSGGETADMPDLVRTVCVDSTLVCRMKRKDVITFDNLEPGDVVVGLASSGQASYESKYNSGIGSNGLTSARHDMFSKSVKEKYPECYDNGLEDDLVFTGNYDLTSKVEACGQMVDAAELVLSPTRTYAPIITQVLKEVDRSSIHGICHCSGGGQTKILHFVNKSTSKHKVQVVKDNLFETPEVFKYIQEESKENWKSMYKIFNMGHRMEIYCKPEVSTKIIQISEGLKVSAQVIGKVDKLRSPDKTHLIIDSIHGRFEYK
eukprot:augustus_masked-scaffold_3-processed-gene-3.67-mRNA-1 protein AED:0.00 eAED:0.00 QI:0/-1/0/1/-1/1/1/0/406